MADILRPYQEKILKNIFEDFQLNNSLLVQMPTGTGKTSVFCVLIKKWIKEYHPNKRVLVLVHRKELVDQIISRLKSYGILAARIQAGHETELTKQVQVGLIQSLKNTKRLPYNLSLIVIDEAHHTPSGSYRDILTHYEKSSPKILGVTATPSRSNGKGFSDLFDKLIVSDPIIEFISKGYLSPIKHLATSIPDLSSVRIDYRSNDFNEEDIEKIMRSEQIMAELIESYEKYAKNKKAIIFAVNKKHSIDIVNRFLEKGYSAKYLDSDTSKEEREQIVKDFKIGEYQILCNVNIFTEGFDCPDIEVVQLARPTKSLALYLQQVGRVMRPFPGKSFGIILDNASNWETHGLISSDFEWSLEKGGIIKKENDNNKVIKKSDIEFISHEMLGLDLYEVETVNSDVKYNLDNKLPYFINPDEDFILLDFYEYLEFGSDEYIIDCLAHDSNDNLNLDLEIFVLNGKYGIVDTANNKILLDPIYENITKPDIYGKCIIEVNELYGIFCCITRELEIQCFYDTIEKQYKETNNNFTFIVSKNDYFGIINKRNLILNCEFDQILIDYSKTPYLFNVRKDDIWLIYKETGQQFDLKNISYSFSVELKKQIICINDVYGILNNSGQYLEFPLIIESIKIEFNYLLLLIYNRWTIWDLEFENMIIDETFESIEFLNQYNLIGKSNGKFGVIDVGNNIHLDFKYELIEQIIPNVYLARNEGLWKIIENNIVVFENSKKKSVIDLYNNKIKEVDSKEWIDNKTYLIRENNLWKIYRNGVLVNQAQTKKEALSKSKHISKYISDNTKITNNISTRKNSSRNDYIIKEYIKIEANNHDKQLKIRDLYKELRISRIFLENILSVVKLNIDLNPNTKISDEIFDFIKKIIEFDLQNKS